MSLYEKTPLCVDHGKQLSGNVMDTRETGQICVSDMDNGQLSTWSTGQPDIGKREQDLFYITGACFSVIKNNM